MKKFLLLLSLVLALGMSAGVHHPNNSEYQTKRISLLAEGAKATASAKTTSRSQADGAIINFAGDPYGWFYISNIGNDTVSYKYFIYITPEVATMLAGNKIEAIEASAYLTSSSQKEGTIFVTEDIKGDPATCTAVTIESVDPQSPNPQIFTLDNPYTIKSGQGFYYGFTISGITREDYPFAFGNTPVNMFAGYFQVIETNGIPNEWPNTFDIQDLNYNLCIKAYTSGDVKSIRDFGVGVSADACDVTLPTFSTEDNISINLGLQNLGENAITSFDYTISVNDAESFTGTAQVDITSKAPEYTVIETPALTSGRKNIGITVTKINSKETNISYSVPILVSEETYKRRFVVEEGTGTWCGYCPYGIIGMDYMATNYPDDFLGIAVHENDKYKVQSYSNLLYNFNSYPTSIWNRDPMWIIYPHEENFAYYYPAFWERQKSAADIELSAYIDGDEIVCDAVTTFGFSDTQADYAIAFVITEDGLTAMQENNLGGKEDATEPWCSTYGNVEWTYTDTARDIFDCDGIKGSIPSEITSGVPYKFRYRCPTTNVTDVNNTAITALLIDRATGVIMNATRVSAANYSGIDRIAANGNDAKVSVNDGCISVEGKFSSARIYSLNGMLIGYSTATVAKGIYLVVVDGVSHKVIVK